MIRQQIFFRDWPDHAARHAGGKAVRGNIPRHHRARADHASFAYGHAAAYGDAAAEPAVVSNGDRKSELQIRDRAGLLVKEGIAVLPAQGVLRRQQRYIRTDENRFPDRNFALVENGKVEIGIAVVTDRRIASAIEENRSL